ncbi:hypothetical protein NMY22_g270 [Coprinellus aureogranulatus]|nr:hypothetical protein NMY22_g270 [Coprinellus aureogranulatus]
MDLPFNGLLTHLSAARPPNASISINRRHLYLNLEPITLLDDRPSEASERSAPGNSHSETLASPKRQRSYGRHVLTDHGISARTERDGHLATLPLVGVGASNWVHMVTFRIESERGGGLGSLYHMVQANSVTLPSESLGHQWQDAIMRPRARKPQ